MNLSTKKLGEVCEIRKGKKPHLKAHQGKGDAPYLTAKFMRGTAETEYASLQDNNAISVSADEIIVICDGSNSGDVFSGFNGVLASTMGKVVHGDDIDTRYLRIFLESNFQRFNGSKKGAAIPHLDISGLYQLEIPLPPLAEQKKIVERIEKQFAKIDEAIRLREQSLAATDALLPATLHEIFSQNNWRKNKIGDLLSIKHGYAFEGKHFGDKGPILLTPGNFREDGGLYFTPKNTKHFSGEYSPEFVLHTGDLVVVMTDLSSMCKILGNPAFVAEDVLHNQRIGKVVLKDNSVLPEYLYYFFLTGEYKKLVRDTATGSTVRHTAPSRIYQAMIPLPPLAEQKRIVKKLDILSAQIRSLRIHQTTQLTNLKALKQSILHEVFSDTIGA